MPGWGGLPAPVGLRLCRSAHARFARMCNIWQECIVASPAIDGQIVFDWYLFQKKHLLPDDTGTPNRFFFGKFIKSETLPKKIAARHAIYSTFLILTVNSKGNPSSKGSRPDRFCRLICLPAGLRSRTGLHCDLAFKNLSGLFEDFVEKYSAHSSNLFPVGYSC